MKYLKPGAKIHIKKANRGKFTEYCGGKVTNECIQRGKSSPNPAIRKRATFAANARKWSHAKGGAFRYGVNVLDSDPKAYKHVKKKYRMHQSGGSFDWGGLASSAVNVLSQIRSNTLKNKAIDKQIEANKEKLKLEKAEDRNQANWKSKYLTDQWAQQQQEAFNSGNGGQNVSDIVTRKMQNDIAKSLVNSNIDQKYKQAELELEQQKQENTNSMISRFGDALVNGINAYGNYLSSKNAAPSTVDTNALDKLNNWSNSQMEALKKQQQQNLFASGNAYLQSKYSTR